ncbi:hypothetical protein H7E68_18055 [Clostridium gasigenes]|uniref:HTH-like domain-containing protein n=1 Tax=Clostridium gasigenes TaxID=94869 RepID=A0A7X0SFG9_9CLOT|nr:hypothetical protein [Clostridium gasigenes]
MNIVLANENIHVSRSKIGQIMRKYGLVSTYTIK